jgi:hypothetical protein
MNQESTPLQFEMFTGQMVDNRSRYRKKLDKTLNQPQQRTMFSLKDTVELGASARPWLKELPVPKLELEREDIRTAEEREHDLLQDAQSLTSAMFGLAETKKVGEQANELDAKPRSVKIPVTIFPQPIVGCRKRLRRAKIRLRRRVL